MRKLKTPQTIPCPVCGMPMLFRSKFRSPYMACSNPICSVTVAINKSTGKPDGMPADKWLRQLRMQTHDYLDKLWRSKNHRYTRKEVYDLLAGYLKIPNNKCHIRMFDKDMCNKAIEFSKMMLNGKVG
jgi:uncharacterized Zn finger protein (UPF0148 family)